MFDIFQYSFIIRALEAGTLVAIIAPLIGIFLVLRRYSLMADTLSHVSLAGIAIGLLIGVNPLLTAIVASVASAISMERLRATKRVYGDTALSLFLSGSLAFALVLLGFAHGFNVNLFSYLFGSILTVKEADVMIIGVLGVVVMALLITLYKELIFIAFDEEAARVSGLKVNIINIIFITIAAIAIALAIPIVGILLVSALMVVPVVAALQFKKGFTRTLVYAEIISVLSTITGIIASFYLNLPAGGTIVLLMLFVFLCIVLFSGKGRLIGER
jgi:zinc transport system permease protein